MGRFRKELRLLSAEPEPYRRFWECRGTFGTGMRVTSSASFIAGDTVPKETEQFAVVTTSLLCVALPQGFVLACGKRIQIADRRAQIKNDSKGRSEMI